MLGEGFEDASRSARFSPARIPDGPLAVVDLTVTSLGGKVRDAKLLLMMNLR